MICAVCRHANDNNAKFCDQCGGPLEMCCPACDRPVRAEARFCSQCGHRLEVSSAPSQVPVEHAVPSVGTLSLDDKLDQLQRYVPQHLAEKILANRGRLEGERKLVTVLFADIAGYTALSEQLGEEALFAMMDELYEAFIHQVHRYEGTVNELTGDGLVAFFGAPLAVEQAPQRAVHSALALQEAAAQFRTRLAHEHDLHLQLRVGINTGPVIVGTIGNDLRMDYKAVGSTVNLAARMEQTAAPSTIRITAQTYKLVEGYFDCEDLGLVTVKGADAKVRVYQVMGAREVHGHIDVARERGFTRLIGRERELETLSRCFDMVRNGRGQAISIIGDAGRNVVVGGGVVCFGAACRYLGMLATTMARWDEAEPHFEHALDMNARMGARPWLAHTQYDYATMLLARHQPNDPEKAADLLHEALTTARALGMRALEERIATQTDQESPRPPTPPPELDDLSPREREVLRLIAAGKSNREIADALFISLNTVATHVRNILTKTGCANHTEATAYAMRQGLAER